ncbi:MAG: hypothetical protein QG641_1256 [Candidatus Poribacteria bacterium]|nr:hypothetical protein [Candidatus Poribacteria bacterium]
MFVFAAIVQAGTWEYDFTKVKGDAWQNDWKVIAGKFELKDGALWQTTASADDNNVFRCLAVTNWEIGDGTIEAKVMHHGAGLNDALIFYRMKDNDNGYASRLQLDSYITIGKISGGKHAHIKYVVTPVVAEKLYTVKIELEGDKITVSVDDEEKVVVEDTFSPKGRIGFGMSRCAGGASIQSIKVTGNGVTAISVDPADKLATTWSEIKVSR